MVIKSEGRYKNCYAWNVDPEKLKRDGHWTKIVYYFKPDLDSPDLVAECEMPVRVTRGGKLKSRAYGLLPIRNNYDQAKAKAKKAAEMMLKRRERQANARRGYVIQDDDKMKVTVLCRHKGEDKYGYVPKKLSPEDAEKRKRNLTLGRAKYAIHILDKLNVPHPNLDKMIA